MNNKFTLFSWKTLLLSIILFLALYYVINLSPIGLSGLHEITNGNTIIDMYMTGYTPDRAYKILSDLGEEGRRFDLHYIVPVDFVFPLAYGFFYIIALSMITQYLFRGFKRFYVTGLLGIIAVLFDFLENIMKVIMLINFPERLISVARAAGFFTVLKGASTILCILLIVLGSILVIIKFIRAKIHNAG